MKKGGIHWGPRTLESVPDATFVSAAQSCQVMGEASEV